MPVVPDLTAARFVVTGLVQGVFFRDSTRREAVRLGLAGWVRNRADGSVEVLAQGPAAAVDRLAAFLSHGPPRATVTGVERHAAEGESPLATFEIRGSR